MIFLTPGEPSGAMFMPAQQNVAKKLQKSNKTWRFGSNTKISAVSGQIGVAKILHGELNTQEWIELFNETRYGTAIIIMGNEYDGAMFIVTKRQGGSCFVQQIYNTGEYNCYKAPDESVADRVVLSVGRQNNRTWYTRDIIVMGSVK